MVGFYSYNPPRMYEALQGCRQARPDHRRRLRRGPDHAGWRRGGLDRRHRRAAALSSGATRARTLIADYLKGDKSEIPADGILIIPGPDADQGQRGRSSRKTSRRSSPAADAFGAPAATCCGRLSDRQRSNGTMSASPATAQETSAEPFLQAVRPAQDLSRGGGARRLLDGRAARRGDRPRRRERRRQVDADEDPRRRGRARQRHASRSTAWRTRR